MKIILLSDVHLLSNNPVARLDNILETGINKFSYVLNYAKKENAKILQAGDLCDSPRIWKLIPILMDLLHNSKSMFYTIRGQHDLFLYNYDIESTIIGILSKCGCISLLNNEPTYLDFNIAVYGCSYGQEIPIPKKNKNVTNILVIHKEILNIVIPYLNMTLSNSFLKENKLYDLILCGDIHKKFIDFDRDRIICNTGPLLRIEASEEMFDHIPGFFIYDTITKIIDWETIPHVKANIVLNRTHIEKNEHKKSLLTNFIQNIKENNTKKFIFDLKKNILHYLNSNNIEIEVRQIIEEKMIND